MIFFMIPDVLAEASYLPQALQTNAEISPQQNHGSFLPNIFPFIIHQLFDHLRQKE
jgi:hypothetical protein